MLTSSECIDFILARNEARGLQYQTLGEDTEVIIHKRDNGEVVIAFDCSNSAVDWKNNLHFWKKAYNDCEIPFTAHSGFLRCWKLVRREIERQVKELKPACITVTGHSYGGAMAVLCMEDMRYCFPGIEIQMVTFGAPRVIGWRNWNKIKDRWANSRQFRCGADFVTNVPFFLWLFHHVTKRTVIGDRPTVIGWFKTAKYHDLIEYSEQIEKIKK